MTKEAIPNTIEELFLVAENDREFYDTVQPAAGQFFKHTINGSTFRETVYKALTNLFRGYNGSAYQYVTSKACVYFACRYAPASKSRGWCRARIADGFAEYSILQAMVLESDISTLVNKQGEMKDLASKVSTRLFLQDWVNEGDQPWAQPTGEFQTAAQNLTQIFKEPIMANNAPIFEIKTFIRGTDATTLNNEAIFSVITEAEARIEQLNKIEHKPKALKDEIEALQLGLQNIVTFVDGRS